MSLALFASHFHSIDEPRQASKITYPLFDVLFLTVAAVIAGAEGWEDIEDFGRCHLDWLKQHGDFTLGIPVHDTIARLVSRVDPSQFQQAFIAWMQQTETLTQGQVIAVDGKTLKSSYDRTDRRTAIHMVNAYATANGVVLGQYKTDAKSNEITAVPALLQLLDIKGCLVSLDAMGCQTSIAQTIIDKEADYLLTVKANQRGLYTGLQEAFSQTTADKLTHVEQGHGRREYREYRVLPASDFTTEHSSWPKLTTLGMAVHYRVDNQGKQSLESRYYICSKTLSAEHFASAVRNHWGIENKVHWLLDVAMHEDGCQIHRGDAAQNLACIRQVALNQLKREKTKKASIRRKQRIAAMDTAYLEKVITA